MLVYHRDRSAQTTLRAATLRWKVQVKLAIPPRHGILTPGQPVPALILQRQAPGRVATGVPHLKSVVWLDMENHPQAGTSEVSGMTGHGKPSTGWHIWSQWYDWTWKTIHRLAHLKSVVWLDMENHPQAGTSEVSGMTGHGKPSTGWHIWSQWYDWTWKTIHRKRGNEPRSGVRNSSSVVCWARFPAWCSVVGSILYWGDFFPVEGTFPMELTRVRTPLPQNFFGWEYKPRSSHAFHRTHSRDPYIHVIDGWMPATKTHPSCTIHKDGMWLPQWLDWKTDTYAKSSPQNGGPQRCSWGTQKNIRLYVGCLTSQQHASVSQGRMCSDNFTCCHTEI